jgi:hypothetical protein
MQDPFPQHGIGDRRNRPGHDQKDAEHAEAARRVVEQDRDAEADQHDQHDLHA